MVRTFRNVFIVLILLLTPCVNAKPTSQPATTPAVVIEVDTSQVPEMAEYGVTVKRVSEKWYPIITAMLPSEGFTPPQHVVVTFKKDMDGVAYTTGDHVFCAPKWFKDHPEDVGAVVHELAHVVQHYTKGKRPGWLVEGIADQVRWFNYEPVDKRPHPRARDAKYDASYQTTAAFLDWARKTYDKDLVVKLNTACREATYTDDLWKDYTGKTMQELGQEWKESLKKPETK